MLYAALTFWLLVIVFAAWGVHGLWSRLIKPRVVNSILLPGTLVAQLGHVLGLLVTGNPVRNTQLMGDDEKGEPTSEGPEKHNIPVLGAVLVGLLPLVACAACLWAAARYLGQGILGKQATEGGAWSVPQELPTTLDGAWNLLHQALDVSQAVLDGILHSNLTDWRNALFVYLAVCLTVRMTPIEGNRRGAVGAIVLFGILTAIVGQLWPAGADAIASSWPILSFAVGMLLFLLLVSLLISGIVGLVRIVARQE